MPDRRKKDQLSGLLAIQPNPDRQRLCEKSSGNCRVGRPPRLAGTHYFIEGEQ